MAKYRLITMVNAKAGREAEMNAWYDDVHMPELRAVPGVVATERFQVRNPFVPSDPLCRYVNVIEIDSEEPMAVLAEIRNRTAAGQMGTGDAYDLVSMGIYETMGGRLVAG